MAGDNEAIGNGIIVTALRSGFGHTLNTAPDLASHVSVECTFSNSPVDVEPERFRQKATNTSSITFSQLDCEAAETWNVVCEYEIYKTP